MPQGVYKQLTCPPGPEYYLSSVPKSPPNPHQEEVADYFIYQSPHKGLLLFHELGSGKTCTAIYIADTMLKMKLVKQVFVLTPGSLRGNWLAEYCKICGTNQLTEKYTFITYNFHAAPQLSRLNFDNSLVIIDEVHNLINGAKNESKTMYELLEKINTSSCKVLALSGTPFYNQTYEWVLLGNMLKPNVFQPLFESQQAWASNEHGLTDSMFRGIVSYYPGNKDQFPTVIHMDPLRVPLLGDHLSAYLDARTRENKVILQGPPDRDLAEMEPETYARKWKSYIFSLQRIRTRQLSNFFPNQGNLKEIRQVLPSGQHLVSYEAMPDTDRSSGGWMIEDLLKNPGLEVLSPKIAALIRNLIQPDHLARKHVIFSSFKNSGGVYFIKTLLDWCGISNLIFSGDEAPARRRKILELFNLPANRYGRYCKVLLLTEAGVEGISLKDVGHFHLLESHPVGGQMEQAMGRVARYRSHEQLPPEHQNVSMWRYFAEPNGRDRESIDVQLYDRAKINKEKLDAFYKRLIDNAVENTNDYDREHAYVPQPVGK